MNAAFNLGASILGSVRESRVTLAVFLRWFRRNFPDTRKLNETHVSDTSREKKG